MAFFYPVLFCAFYLFLFIWICLYIYLGPVLQRSTRQNQSTLSFPRGVLWSRSSAVNHAPFATSTSQCIHYDAHSLFLRKHTERCLIPTHVAGSPGPSAVCVVQRSLCIPRTYVVRLQPEDRTKIHCLVCSGSTLVFGVSQLHPAYWPVTGRLLLTSLTSQKHAYPMGSRLHARTAKFQYPPLPYPSLVTGGPGAWHSPYNLKSKGLLVLPLLITGWNYKVTLIA